MLTIEAGLPLTSPERLTLPSPLARVRGCLRRSFPERLTRWSITSSTIVGSIEQPAIQRSFSARICRIVAWPLYEYWMSKKSSRTASTSLNWAANGSAIFNPLLEKSITRASCTDELGESQSLMSSLLSNRHTETLSVGISEAAKRCCL